jgi:hypothetical protein
MTQQDLLSSDILEAQFGPTDIIVLYQDADLRVISTRVIATNQLLELSQVSFIADGVSAFPEIHERIRLGESMGKAFRESAVPFIRSAQHVQLQQLPDIFIRLYKDSRLSTVVTTTILLGPRQIPYAHLLETYNPFVVWPDTIKQATHSALDSTISAKLEAFGVLLSDCT